MLYNYFSIAQKGQKMKTKRKTKVIRSNKPYYITAAVIAGIALIFPMYSLFWLIVTAAVAGGARGRGGRLARRGRDVPAHARSGTVRVE